MKPGDRRYTVEMLQAGQPRAYADTVHEFILSVEWIPYRPGLAPQAREWEPSGLSELLVKEAGRTLGHNFKEKSESPGPFDSTLEAFANVGPGKWRFKVVTPYTD